MTTRTSASGDHGPVSPAVPASGDRLQSLDALRGFDMGGFGEIARVFLGGFKPHLGAYWHQVVIVLARFALAWAVLIHLHRHKIFLRL